MPLTYVKNFIEAKSNLEFFEHIRKVQTGWVVGKHSHMKTEMGKYHLFMMQ